MTAASAELRTWLSDRGYTATDRTRFSIYPPSGAPPQIGARPPRERRSPRKAFKSPGYKGQGHG